MQSVSDRAGLFVSTSGLTPIEKIQACKALVAIADTNSFEKTIQRKAECISADEYGTVVYKLEMEPWVCNDRKVMNGAAAALVVEWVSLASALVFARPGYWAVANPSTPDHAYFLGVTRNISVTWCGMAPLGTTLHIRGKVQHITPRQALIQCEAVDKTSGRLVFTGSHDMQCVAGNSKAIAQILGHGKATAGDPLEVAKL